MPTTPYNSVGSTMEGGDTLTFSVDGAFHIYHLWSDIDTEQSHDVPDSPNNTGTANVEVVTQNARTIRGTITIASEMQVPKVVNARGAVTQDKISMLAQRDNLYSLEGKVVTAYARSIRNGFFTGVMRLVRAIDSGRHDRSMQVQFEVKEHLRDDTVSVEDDVIIVPIPVPPQEENPTQTNVPPGTGGHTCTRAQLIGAAIGQAIGISKVVEFGRKVKEVSKKAWDGIKRGWNWLADKAKAAYTATANAVSNVVTSVRNAAVATGNFTKGVFAGACQP